MEPSAGSVAACPVCGFVVDVEPVRACLPAFVYQVAFHGIGGHMDEAKTWQACPGVGDYVPAHVTGARNSSVNPLSSTLQQSSGEGDHAG